MHDPYYPRWIRAYNVFTGWLGCSVWTFVILALIVAMFGGFAYAGVSSTRILGVFIFAFPLSLFGAGVLGALIALPPLRAVARLNTGTRTAAAACVSLVVLCAALLLWGWTFATLTYSSADRFGACFGGPCEELTLRHALPPLLRAACLRGVPNDCT